MIARRQWIIGRSADCDIALDQPGVSARHCRLTETASAVLLEDLGSTNGTFVNGVQITAPVRITRGHHITLGLSVLLPWPDGIKAPAGLAAERAVRLGDTPITLGRDPKCDLVVLDPQVSRQHARLTRSGKGWQLEDLDSTNGTFLNNRRLARPKILSAGDSIGLGGHRFTLTEDGCLQGGDRRGRVTLEACAVSVEVPPRRLLDDISLTIFPSEFVGLMGPSGAGKTTLMNALNGFTPPTDGDVLLNGLSLYDFCEVFSSFLSYVPQDDIMHRDLTVGQALFYTARLRLPSDYSRADIRERIRTVLGQLNLEGTENVLIGSPEKKGVSGGQRKRVNLAMELLTDPLVLFLDEPTSGLFSEDALVVMKGLRGLADAGKTILLTLHQPSLEAFRLMDNLVVVSRDKAPDAAGVLAYYGPAYPDAITFFNPDHATAAQKGAELSPDDIFRGMSRQPASAWNAAYKKSRYHRKFVAAREGKETAEHDLPAAGRQPLLFSVRQWWVLVRRCLVIKAKDTWNTAILLAQAPVVAVLVVLVFGSRCRTALTVDDVMQVANSVAVVIFLLGLSALWFGCSNAVREIVGEWAVYRRERMVNLRLGAYVASKFAVLGGLCVVQCATLLAVVYLGCDLQGDWWLLFAVLLLVALVGVALGLTVSALARTSEMAIALLPLVLLPMVILGGILLPLKDMHQSVRLLCYLMPSRWAFEGMLVVESDARPVVPMPAVPGSPQETPDFAEGYFPKKDDFRLGVPASVMGLATLFVVLAVAIHVILRSRDVH
jgi:ABC-type multidrug transport system ATPase subunit/pSer/pThr/pTyr-binding forkhead associated (FHA) protein